MRLRDHIFNFLTAILLVPYLAAFAASLSIPLSNLQIYFGDSLLDVQGRGGVLEEVDSTANRLDITMPADSSVKITSPDGRVLSVSPSTYSQYACTSKESAILIQIPSDGSSVSYTVSLGSDTCAINSSSELQLSPPTPPPPLSEGFSAIGAGVSEVGSSIGETLSDIVAGLTGEKPLEIIQEAVSRVSGATQKVVTELRASPAVQRVVRTVAIPITISVTAVSAGAVTVTASVGSASFAFNATSALQQLSMLRFYALGFIRIRRKKPWGRVVNQFGRPLAGAFVQIYDADFKKIRDTETTDILGRFSAAVSPGNYYIKVKRRGFQDYETKPLAITSPEQALNIEITLLPEPATLSVAGLRLIKFWNAVRSALEAINPYLLVIGTLASILTLTLLPNTLNKIVLEFYLLLDAVKIYFALRYVKPFGVVRDERGQPMALAVIRIFEARRDILLATKATDDLGRFNFLLAPGEYYITCWKTGFMPFRSERLTASKEGLATIDIALRRA